MHFLEAQPSKSVRLVLVSQPPCSNGCSAPETGHRCSLAPLVLGMIDGAAPLSGNSRFARLSSYPVQCPGKTLPPWSLVWSYLLKALRTNIEVHPFYDCQGEVWRFPLDPPRGEKNIEVDFMPNRHHAAVMVLLLCIAGASHVHLFVQLATAMLTLFLPQRTFDP